MMKRNLVLLIISGVALIGGTIDLNHLPNYANQPVPSYIAKDNTPLLNPITDAGAALGRVLFYDKNLSVNDSVACANCHMQQFAFTDTAVQSVGLQVQSAKHSMRLVNMRFADDPAVLWAKNVANQEAHNTLPIKSSIVMGFSGQQGLPGLDSLYAKMEATGYYSQLFELAFGDVEITELRISAALSQFVRSIQSFDSKYDAGRALVTHDSVDFPNFSLDENLGKRLFMDDPIFDTVPDTQSIRVGGGAGCATCHRPPEFDIDPFSLNNGIVADINGNPSFTNFRSPTLRDMMGADGSANSPFMHTGGSISDPMEVDGMLDHYDHIMPAPGLDPRLSPEGFGQQLHLTADERVRLVAFFKTLTGTQLYVDDRWSDPFRGSSTPLVPPKQVVEHFGAPQQTGPVIYLFTSGGQSILKIKSENGLIHLDLFTIQGQELYASTFTHEHSLRLSDLQPGIAMVRLRNATTGQITTKKLWIPGR